MTDRMNIKIEISKATLREALGNNPTREQLGDFRIDLDDAIWQHFPDADCIIEIGDADAISVDGGQPGHESWLKMIRAAAVAQWAVYHR